MLKYKPDTAAALAARVLEPGDAVLEVGAADGTYTARYADRVGPEGYVVAVEPHPESRRALRQVVATRPWVTCMAAAVGATPGTAWLYTDRRDAKRSSLHARNVHAGDQAQAACAVRVTTIDALVEAMPRTPALIVVDAQGAEAAILAGATRTLRLPIVWVVEVWPAGLARAGATVGDVLAPFQARGYRPATTHGAGLGWAETPALCAAAGRRKQGHVDLVLWP